MVPGVQYRVQGAPGVEGGGSKLEPPSTIILFKHDVMDSNDPEDSESEPTTGALSGGGSSSRLPFASGADSRFVAQEIQAIDFLKVVGFTLGSQEFVVNILQVKEIKLMLPLTPIPKSPVYLDGVANLRGDIIPVINLRKKLNLPVSKHTEDTRIMVVEQESRLVGIIVDSVTEVHLLPADSISPPPSALGGINVQLIRGVARAHDRLLVFLDIDRILSPGSTSLVGLPDVG